MNKFESMAYFMISFHKSSTRHAPANTGSFWMLTVGDPGLSKYGNVSLHNVTMLTSIFLEVVRNYSYRLTDTINTVILWHL